MALQRIGGILRIPLQVPQGRESPPVSGTLTGLRSPHAVAAANRWLDRMRTEIHLVSPCPGRRIGSGTGDPEG